MALNWNLSEVSNENIEYCLKNNEATDAIIMLTMAVGISKITKANANEFYLRASFCSKLFSYTNRPFTLEEIEKRIGLYTNASEFSRAEFVKRQTKHFFEQ